MNIVHVIQDSPGKNLDPAKEYGELFVMLTGRETTEEAHRKLTQSMSNFDAEDFILLIGNPVFMSMAVIIAAEIISPMRRKLQLLVWNRETYTYRLERIYA